jgi:hypothetical protein
MRFLALLAAASAAFAQTIVTSDIENFWKAYDAAAPGSREESFATLYLEPGSVGLQDFVKARINSARALANAVDKRYPKFYASVRPYTLQVDRQIPKVREYLARYQELYPQAHFPAVYFLIGRLTSGGTVSGRGLLIGTEVFSLGKDVDASEISPSFRRAMGTPERIPLIVVHELTHTQINPFAKTTIPPMLAQCLGEGSADFMSELVGGSSINAVVKEWAEPRHDEIFQRFARDMAANPKDTSKWMYNYDNAGEEPADLGYWIGNEICRSYYEQAPDKAKAIRDIVRQENLDDVVRHSNYAWLVVKDPR